MSGPVEDATAILDAMDRNGVERLIVLSRNEFDSLEVTRKNLEDTRRFCDQARDRLTPLAWVQPLMPGMHQLAKEALHDMRFAGFKIIPNAWHACEERLEPWWELMDELGAPILFHTGILYMKNLMSRFCRPVYLEKLAQYPRIKFAMAHISWPWCEECLALMGQMRAVRAREGKADGWQSYIDITPGAPPHIRKQALANAIDFCGLDRLMFGSDDAVPGSLEYQKSIVDNYRQIFDELGLDPMQQQQIFANTADKLFPVAR